MRSKRFIWSSLLLSVVILVLACRTVDTLAQLRPGAANNRIRATRTATKRPTRVANSAQPNDATPTAIVAVTDVPSPPTDAPAAAEPTQPKSQPARPPTNRSAARPTERPPDTPVPPPPTPAYPYRIRESRCGPNVRTYIEGYVYEGSVGKNGLLVRISQGPDGQPDPNDDYKTGTDTKRKGYYYQNIDSNNPHAGTWYLWVIDPATMQRISEIAIVKTDGQRVEDSGNSAGSCQSATVSFTTQPPPATPRPTATRNPNSGAQPTPTRDNLNDSGK